MTTILFPWTPAMKRQEREGSELLPGIQVKVILPSSHLNETDLFFCWTARQDPGLNTSTIQHFAEDFIPKFFLEADQGINLRISHLFVDKIYRLRRDVIRDQACFLQPFNGSLFWHVFVPGYFEIGMNNQGSSKLA